MGAIQLLLRIGLLVVMYILPVTAAAEGLPLVVIEQGSPISAQTVESLEHHIAQTMQQDVAPLPGEIITRKISAPTLRHLNHRFVQAKDLFYSGELAESLDTLEDLHQKLLGGMPSVTFQGDLRALDRDVLLYSIMVNRELNNTTGEQTSIDFISQNYADIPFAGSEFPPWLRELTAEAAKKIQKKTVRVTIATDPDCETEVDGKIVAATDRTTELPTGLHTFKAVCQSGHESLMSQLAISETATEWRPIHVPGYRARVVGQSLVFSAESNQSPAKPASAEQFWQLLPLLRTSQLLLIHHAPPHIQAALIGYPNANGSARGGMQSTASANTRTKEAEAIFPVVDEVLQQPWQETAQDALAPVAGQKWYRAPLPWALVATGAVMAATGLILGLTEGRPSTYEPLIWTLQISGATLLGTGAVLFVLPSYQKREQEQSLGIVTGLKF